jgi:(R,R)-butanediol dehydrogenase/meso-butanediol dehydrogenase/diacetyl reductase
VGGGTIGLFALQAAKAAGVREVTVIEPLEKRREIALRYGACATIDPFSEEPLQAVRQVTGGKGVDAVVECSGAKTAGMLAASIARPRGRIAILGIFEQPALLNYFDLVVGEKQIYGSVSGYGFFDPAIQLLADGKVEVDGLITGRIELDELPDMLKKLSQNPEEHIKVMVSPGDS